MDILELPVFGSHVNYDNILALLLEAGVDLKHRSQLRMLLSMRIYRRIEHQSITFLSNKYFPGWRFVDVFKHTIRHLITHLMVDDLSYCITLRKNHKL